MANPHKTSTDEEKVLVRYKFKNAKEENEKWMTRSQYENLKAIPSIEYCKIVAK